MDFEFRPLNEERARAILPWSYRSPLDFYNAADGDTRALTTLLVLAARSPQSKGSLA